MTANLKTLIPVLGLAFISTLSQATSQSPSQSTPQSTSSDFLVHETVSIASTSSSAVLDRTAANLDQVFARYQPKFDSSTTILSPLAVTGTALHPILKLSAQKCVAFICETVDMDGVVSLEPAQGSCKRNFVLSIDLTRSSEVLSGVYDSLNVSICYNSTATGSGTLALDATAHHASGYSQGPIQQQIFDMLKLQVDPLTAAINASLKANSVGL